MVWASFRNEQVEDPRKALNMKLNENAQGDGLIPRREHHVRKDIIQKEGITCEEAREGKSRQRYPRGFIDR